MRRKIGYLTDRMDNFTLTHSLRVMKIAAELEEYLKIDTKKLRVSALLHDVGKIYVPPNILYKKGCLDTLEREIIDLHSYVGYSLLKSNGFDEDICRIVLYHHGFTPVTLHSVPVYETVEIIKYSSMLRSIDVYEALTSDRPYHKAIPPASALRKMEKLDFSHPDVLEYVNDVIRSTKKTDSAVRSGCKSINRGSVKKVLDDLEQHCRN